MLWTRLYKISLRSLTWESSSNFGFLFSSLLQSLTCSRSQCEDEKTACWWLNFSFCFKCSGLCICCCIKGWLVPRCFTDLFCFWHFYQCLCCQRQPSFKGSDYFRFNTSIGMGSFFLHHRRLCKAYPYMMSFPL